MKNLFFLLIIPLFSFGQFFGNCIKGNCENGNGTWKWADGGKFVGLFKDGHPVSGQGKVYYNTNDYFLGELQNGERYTGKTFNEHGQLIREERIGKLYFGKEKIIDASGGGKECDMYYENGIVINCICNTHNKHNVDDINSRFNEKIIDLIPDLKTNSFYLNLTINNRKVKFCFDTGCSGFTMNETQWGKLNKGLEYEDLNISGNSQVAGGNIYPTKYYKIIEEIYIDELPIENVIISVTQTTSPEKPERDNLIGIDFFKKFSNVIWDMQNKTLKLEW